MRKENNMKHNHSSHQAPPHVFVLTSMRRLEIISLKTNATTINTFNHALLLLLAKVWSSIERRLWLVLCFVALTVGGLWNGDNWSFGCSATGRVYSAEGHIIEAKVGCRGDVHHDIRRIFSELDKE